MIPQYSLVLSLSLWRLNYPIHVDRPALTHCLSNTHTHIHREKHTSVCLLITLCCFCVSPSSCFLLVSICFAFGSLKTPTHTQTHPGQSFCLLLHIWCSVPPLLSMLTLGTNVAWLVHRCLPLTRFPPGTGRAGPGILNGVTLHSLCTFYVSDHSESPGHHSHTPGELLHTAVDPIMLPWLLKKNSASQGGENGPCVIKLQQTSLKNLYS